MTRGPNPTRCRGGGLPPRRSAPPARRTRTRPGSPGRRTHGEAHGFRRAPSRGPRTTAPPPPPLEVAACPARRPHSDPWLARSQPQGSHTSDRLGRIDSRPAKAYAGPASRRSGLKGCPNSHASCPRPAAASVTTDPERDFGREVGDGTALDDELEE